MLLRISNGRSAGLGLHGPHRRRRKKQRLVRRLYFRDFRRKV